MIWNVAARTFGELLKVFSTKVNLLYIHYSMAQRCCLLHLIKQNCLLKTSQKTLIFDDSGTSLPVFPSFVKSIWSCWIPVVVLKNCEPELSHILAELFNMSKWVFVSQVVGKPHWWPLYLGIFGKSAAKNYYPATLLSVVSEVFEKLVNNRCVGHVKNCWPFFWFPV